MSVSFHPCRPCLRRPSHCELDNLLLLASLRTCRANNKRLASSSTSIVTRLLIQYCTGDHFKNKTPLIPLTFFDARSACLKSFYQSNRHTRNIGCPLCEDPVSTIGQVNLYLCILGWFRKLGRVTCIRPPHRDDKSQSVDPCPTKGKRKPLKFRAITLYYSVQLWESIALAVHST